MSRSHPHCDRHPNLQMVACWVKSPKGISNGHVCPVPGCDRSHVNGTYLSREEIEMVVGPKPVASANATMKKGPGKESGAARPLNRQTAARAAILRAIREKQPQ